MKPRAVVTRLAFGAIFVFCGSGLLGGCSAAVDQQRQEPTRSSAGAEHIVFEGTFSKTGVYRVFESAEGLLALSVGGAIGTEDYQAVGKRLERSLVKTYLSLRPDLAAAPDALVALDVRYQKQIASIVRETPLGPPALEPAPSIHVLDVNSFNATACQNLTVHCGYYEPYNCQYLYNSTEVCAGGYAPYDYSAGWNVDSAHWALHDVAIPNGPLGPWGRWIQPGYWQWDQWAQPSDYSQVCMEPSSSDPVGGLGVTVHKFVPIPC